MNNFLTTFTIGLAFLTLLIGCMSTTSVPTEITSDGLGTISDITSDITSSTSPDSSNSDNSEAETFIRQNRNRIARDMAMGTGEHLAALAILLKIPTDKQDEFFDLSQRNFTQIFSYNEINEKELLYRITALTASLTPNPSQKS
ncbi:MAG: DUF3015 domain-containing protein [Desulfobulbaceae bacterium]|nr:DUF3015 domain-containing protein [Desulfobulbaceae bacterium]